MKQVVGDAGRGDLLEVNLSLALTARDASGKWLADLRVEVISLAIAGLQQAGWLAG
jgi:hypothetical protein